MNKILLLLAIALAFVAFSTALKFPASNKGGGLGYFAPPTNSCEQSIDCQKSGKSCSGTFDIYGVTIGCNASSANSSCCGYGLMCVNSTCVSDTIGDYCTTAAQCLGGGPFVACQNNTCVQLGLPGDECSTDTDCYFGTSSCVDSVCSGLGVGAKCNPAGQGGLGKFVCAPQLYCQTAAKKSSCQPQIAVNQTCNPLRDVCADGNICSYKGVCIVPFQGASGTKCAFNEECSTDNYCSPNGTCATWNSWSQTECTDNSGCSSGELCTCDQITGEQFCVPILETVVSYCAENEQSATECLSQHNCSYYYATAASGTLPPNSCASQNCKSSFKKAASCGCSTAKDLWGTCFYSEYCGGFPVWAIIVIAIVGVILVLVVIVVIVMVMRRRRTYDTIA